MLGRLLSSVVIGYVAYKVLLTFAKKKRVDKICWKPDDHGVDMISELPDDLLVQILMFLPTQSIVATMILSKRWRYVWTMVPQLFYKDTNNLYLWSFLENSLQNHKAPVLETLVIELAPGCPIDVDVGHCIANAVERRVRVLWFELLWSAMPITLPISLYNTCDRLYQLHLSGKILVDIPSTEACFPSLQHLSLYSVVYKDQDSHVRFLSSCPILKYLYVERRHKDNDNVTKFTIKVPSLEFLSYDYVTLEGEQHISGSLVIDSPVLKRIFIRDYSLEGGSCSIENNPRFDKAIIHVSFFPDEKFTTSLSSIKYFELILGIQTADFFKTINFNQLIWCKIIIQYDGLDWLQPLTHLLQNSPNLKSLFIDELIYDGMLEYVPLSWNEPSSVPECLEIFEWREYRGRSEEIQLVRYIFANCKRLRKVGIAMKSTLSRKDKKKIMEEIEVMPRVSTSTNLVFSAQLKLLDFRKELDD